MNKATRDQPNRVTAQAEVHAFATGLYSGSVQGDWSRGKGVIEGGTHGVTLARRQAAPHSLALRQINVLQWKTNLANRIITAESVIVQNLHVERPVHQLAVGKSCQRNRGQRSQRKGLIALALNLGEKCEAEGFIKCDSFHKMRGWLQEAGRERVFY